MGTETPLGSPPRTGRLRHLRVVALTAAICLALTGCGFREQTNEYYQAAAGITNRGHEVYVLNALVVTDGKSNGTLVGTLINMTKSSDSLQSVKAVDSSGKSITTKLTSPVKLAPSKAVKLETNGAVRLTGNLKPGYYISVTFTFTTASPLSMALPVVPNGSEYSSVPVGPA